MNFQEAKNNFLKRTELTKAIGTYLRYKKVIDTINSPEQIQQAFDAATSNCGANTKNQYTHIINSLIKHINTHSNFKTPFLEKGINTQRLQKQALNSKEMSLIRFWVERHSIIQEKIAIFLLIETGIRIAEYESFLQNITAVTLKTGWTKIQTKGKQTRYIRISDELKSLINFVWSNDLQLQWLGSTTSRQNRISLIGTLSGLDRKISAHIFRYTAITNFYKHHKDIVATKKFAGHASIDQTTQYISHDQETLGRMIDVAINNDFDSLEKEQILKRYKMELDNNKLLLEKNEQLKSELQILRRVNLENEQRNHNCFGYKKT